LEEAAPRFGRRFTSELALIEVARAGRRIAGPEGLARAHAVLRTATKIAFTRELRDSAAALEPAGLGALDALHLATALSLRPVVAAFVCYDRRLCDAATAAGLDVLSPGAPTGPAG